MRSDNCETVEFDATGSQSGPRNAAPAYTSPPPITPAARWEKKPPPPEGADFAAPTGGVAAVVDLGAAPDVALAAASIAGCAGFVADAPAGPAVATLSLSLSLSVAGGGVTGGTVELAAAALGGLPASDVAALEAAAPEAAEALALVVGVAGARTSVALRSSVACGRFPPGLSVRPASFAGSGLSVMGAGSPGSWGSASRTWGDRAAVLRQSLTPRGR